MNNNNRILYKRILITKMKQREVIGVLRYKKMIYITKYFEKQE